ncbi:UDP-glycosyltransferase UGT5-like [Nymphalis io]|uniref:UDP-glycosyltransferase UGT5-like n=1 Tax=Inachis io TaxID=171585 RepID=UPI00216A892C|nr:UDP-glycosyltransferase UGT5-like [Nymphalis io]
MSRLIYFFTLIIHFYDVNTANILGLFTHTGKSHHMVFEPLLLKLAERGHNLTVASFFPASNPPPNYNEISFQGLHELGLESFDLNAYENSKIFKRIPRIGSIASQLLQFRPFAIASLSICEKLTNFKPLLEALKGDYDVVLLENFTSDCMLGLIYAYGINAPIVYIMSGTPMPWSSERIGANDNPSYVPLITAPFSSRMSLMDRLENTLINIILKEWYYNEIQTKERYILEKKFGKIQDLRELGKNVSLMLTNSYHTLNGVKPLVPGMVEVGGLHLTSKREPLPQFIEKFLNDSSDDGVILFSFGSLVKTKSLPKYKEQIFINALSKLKQRVIWKFEDSDEEGTLAGNILKVKWLPQYDLLRHEKIIAFICHGGLLGMTEAMAAGKPMIIVPIFGDQLSNAAAAAEAGVGIVLPYDDLKEDILSNALQTVISDKMRTHTRLVSKIWHDRDMSPLDKAVFWTEHVIRWGMSTHLHSTARNLTFYQLTLLDVAAIIIFTISLLIIMIVYLIYKFLHIFKKSTKEKLL